MDFNSIKLSLNKKQSSLRVTNICLLVIIVLIVIVGIYIFSIESLNVQNQIAISLKEKIQDEKSYQNKLNEERKVIFSYLIPLSKINRSTIDEVQFEDINKFRTKYTNGIDVQLIKDNEKMLNSIIMEYILLPSIAEDYMVLREIVEKWNYEQKYKYGEYYSKELEDIRFLYISNFDYTDENSKYKGNYAVKKFDIIMSVALNDYNYKINTITKEMEKFNIFAKNAITKLDNDISNSKNALEQLNKKLSDEIKRLEKPSIIVYGVLISKAMTAIFLFFLIQILLSTFRYLLQVQNRYENQLLLLEYLTIKPDENYKILSLLVNEKIELDKIPEPLIKDIIHLTNLK